jgi:hypothetical protein
MALTAYERGTRGVSLAAVISTGAGDEFALAPYFLGVLPSVFAFDILITGSPSGVTVLLEGSLDGTNWFTMETVAGTSDSLNFSVDKPVRFVRANLTVLTGGSSPTVAVGIAA